MSDKQPGGEYAKQSHTQYTKQDPKSESEDTTGHSHTFDPKSVVKQSHTFDPKSVVRQAAESDEDDVSGHAAAPKQVVRQGTPEPPTRDR